MTRIHAIGVVLALSIVGCVAHGASAAKAVFPDPTVDDPLAKGGQMTMVVAGGCFWGIEAVFEHVKGVTDAVSGYSGGAAKTASYEMVSTDTTGHAESVKVTYDPSQISYGQLLKVFFAVAHDPTGLKRQGPDTGTQYRSVIFYNSDEQQRIARAYIAQLGDAKTYRRRIVTEIVPLQGFYPAEAYHQDYFDHHPADPYILFNDRPKVESLRKQYPELWVERH